MGTGTIGASSYGYCDLNLQTSNNTLGLINWGGKYRHNGYHAGFEMSHLFDMDAGDVATVFLAIASGTTTIDFQGGSTFAGHLMS